MPARLTALEGQVENLAGLVLEMGELLEDLARANAGALSRQRAAAPWQAQRPRSRWG